MQIKKQSKVESSWQYLTDGHNDGDSEFKILPLTGSMLDEVMEGVNLADFRPTAKGTSAALKYGLKDWRGIHDENGDDINFSRSLFEILPFTVRLQIACRVIELSNISDDDSKN